MLLLRRPFDVAGTRAATEHLPGSQGRGKREGLSRKPDNRSFVRATQRREVGGRHLFDDGDRLVFQNNAAARAQIRSKVTRAWTRDKKLASTVVTNLQTVNVLGSTQFAFEVDIERLNRSLELVAHGLHFHQFGVHAPNPYRAISYPIAKLEGAEANEVNRGRANILRLADEFLRGLPAQGANPEIFWYQLSSEVEGRHVLRMCFYEAFTVIALSSPTTGIPAEEDAAPAAGTGI
jgi:hypothetical protein